MTPPDRPLISPQTASYTSSGGFRVSGAQFKSLVRRLSQIVWRASADGAEIIAPRWTELTGVTEQDLADFGWLNTLHPDDRDATSVVCRRAIEAGADLNLEFRLRLTDGSYRWFRAHGQPSRGLNGEIDGWIGMTQDIDEEKRAVEALHDNEERLRMVIEAAGVGIFDWDLETDEVQLDDRARQILCIGEPSPIPADQWQRTIHSEDALQVRAAIETALDPIGRGQYETVYRIARPDGAPAWVNARGRVRFLNSRDGPRGVRFLGTITDLTPLYARDEQLREAQKLDAVGQLAAGIGHDLNNILTAVLAGVHMVVQNGALDAKNQSRLTQVRDECVRAAAVIRELLTFARKQVVAPGVYRLNDIIRDIQPMLNHLLGAGIVQDVRLEANGGVYADRAGLVQALITLASNARDSMPSGGTLSIHTYDVPDDAERSGQRVVLAISDTGPGLDEATRSRLFEPFFTTNSLGRGRGLGLSVVYGMIAQMQGTITAQSSTDTGTTFTISLPRVDPAPIIFSVNPAEAIDLRGNETILLVEDERTVRENLAEALKELGYVVLEAEHGYDALMVLERHAAPVHLVLSDVVMPEMSGAELVAQLRDWYPNLRVLFITGYSAEAIERYGLVVSDTGLLPKPFELDQLAKRVRRVLDSPRPVAV